MKNNPLFTVVIPTYNRASLLKRCLESVIAQTVNDWEAIVVDNYSEDNTEEVVTAFHDERIRYVKNHNYGVIAVSRNKALDIATGKWVAFLDSDDCWLPNKLESMKPYMQDYDLVYHGYRQNVPNNSAKKYARYFYEIKEPTVGYVLMRGDPINPSCTCVSRTAIGEIRFDESKELFAVEDYDFFLQLIYKGIRIKYLHEIYTFYDVSGVSHSPKLVDRDTALIAKWRDKVPVKDQRELDIQIIRRDASVKYAAGDYKAAIQCYRKCMGSRLPEKRWIGIKGYLNCLLHSIKK